MKLQFESIPAPLNIKILIIFDFIFEGPLLLILFNFLNLKKRKKIAITPAMNLKAN